MTSTSSCFLCRDADQNSNALPEVVKPFLLRSVLQLSYNSMANFSTENELILLCEECKTLVTQAFDLKEEMHNIKVQLNKLLDKLKFRMKAENELQILGTQLASETAECKQNNKRKSVLTIRPDDWDGENEGMQDSYGSSADNDGVELEDHVVKVEPSMDQDNFLYEDSEAGSNCSFEIQATSSSFIVNSIPQTHSNIFESDIKPQQSKPSYQVVTKQATTFKPSSSEKSSTGYYCKYEECKLFLLTESRLKAHYEREHGERFDQPGKSDRNICHFKGCGEEFPLKKWLEEHRKLCHDKPHPCEYRGCRKRFETSNLLRDHIYSVHKNKMRHKYKCVIPGCSKVFKYERQFTLHQARCQFKYNYQIENKNS